MRHARRNLQRIVRLTAVGGLICGGLLVSSAVASEPAAPQPDTGDSAHATDMSEGLVSRLGASRTAGSWMDSEGRPVVAVTDEEAAAEVRKAGARAKMVRYSMNNLRSATDALREAPRTPGTAWAMDYGSNKVMVRADSTVSKADWSRMTAIAEQIGGPVEMERTKGAFTTRLNGAEAFFARDGRCSVGFNVTNGQDNFILTAGHCGPAGTTWFQTPQRTGRIGTTVTGDFPGNDFALVQYQNEDPFDTTNVVDVGDGQGVRISAAADPVVGQQVFRSGSTTGLQSGEVTAVNVTVNYPEGTVSGLIEAAVCAEPGDSGGPLFAQGMALGVTSGGNGDCTSGGVTFFQPATKALEALGVNLVGGAESAGGEAVGELAPGEKAAGAGQGAPPPARQGTMGATDGPPTLDRILAPQTLTPGLTLITVSLIGLMAARWFRSGPGRRRYRSSYPGGWG
jgi:streptogrisin D